MTVSHGPHFFLLVFVPSSLLLSVVDMLVGRRRRRNILSGTFQWETMTKLLLLLAVGVVVGGCGGGNRIKKAARPVGVVVGGCGEGNRIKKALPPCSPFFQIFGSIFVGLLQKLLTVILVHHFCPRYSCFAVCETTVTEGSTVHVCRVGFRPRYSCGRPYTRTRLVTSVPTVLARIRIMRNLN